MRQAEILNLTWKEIDLKKGFIRLGGLRTKNKTEEQFRCIRKFLTTFRAYPVRFMGDMFLSKDAGIESISESLKIAGIEDFTYHDLRHCALNNLRLAGMTVTLSNKHLVIKQIVLSNVTFLLQKMKWMGMKWLDQKEGKTGTMDTYMDTTDNFKKDKIS